MQVRVGEVLVHEAQRIFQIDSPREIAQLLPMREREFHDIGDHLTYCTVTRGNTYPQGSHVVESNCPRQLGVDAVVQATGVLGVEQVVKHHVVRDGPALEQDVQQVRDPLLVSPVRTPKRL
jgi:hypothetical protein